MSYSEQLCAWDTTIFFCRNRSLFSLNTPLEVTLDEYPSASSVMLYRMAMIKSQRNTSSERWRRKQPCFIGQSLISRKCRDGMTFVVSCDSVYVNTEQKQKRAKKYSLQQRKTTTVALAPENLLDKAGKRIPFLCFSFIYHSMGHTQGRSCRYGMPPVEHSLICYPLSSKTRHWIACCYCWESKLNEMRQNNWHGFT